MSLLFYKIIHILGLLLLFSALGALVAEPAAAHRKLLASLHGLALVLILLSGFGMLAKLGGGFPGWAVAKLVIWLALGASTVIARRLPSWRAVWWIGFPVLGAVAGYLAFYKPF